MMKNYFGREKGGEKKKKNEAPYEENDDMKRPQVYDDNTIEEDHELLNMKKNIRSRIPRLSSMMSLSLDTQRVTLSLFFNITCRHARLIS